MRIEPGQDVAAITRAAAEDTTFLLGAGVHRNVDIKPRNGQRFVGERGPNCERLTTLNGSMEVTNWTDDDGMWKATGHQRTVEPREMPCRDGYPRCTHPNDLYIDGQPLHHVGSRSNVERGTWFFDYEADTLWIGENPSKRLVELSVTEAAFRPTADDVRVSGLIMKKYANQPQYGVVGRYGAGSGWLVDDNDLRSSHAVGVVVGPNSKVANNFVTGQGSVGIKAYGAGSEITENVIEQNGWVGQLFTWEGGGIKVSAENVTISNNCITENVGNGIWGDVHSIDVRIVDNVVFDNVTQGIQYETSRGGLIRGNKVGHNGTRTKDSDRSWLYNSQIMVSTSSGVDVVGNQVETNKHFGHGITVVWQDRGGDSAAVDNQISNNEITFLRPHAVSGLSTDFTGGEGVFQQNEFKNNRYHSKTPNDDHFRGVDGKMTLEEMKADGQEIGSSMDSDVDASTWSCPTR